jgi:hypothetical protein
LYHSEDAKIARMSMCSLNEKNRGIWNEENNENKKTFLWFLAYC